MTRIGDILNASVFQPYLLPEVMPNPQGGSLVSREDLFVSEGRALAEQVTAKPEWNYTDQMRGLLLTLAGRDASIRWGLSKTGRVRISELPHEAVRDVFYNALSKYMHLRQFAR